MHIFITYIEEIPGNYVEFMKGDLSLVPIFISLIRNQRNKSKYVPYMMPRHKCLRPFRNSYKRKITCSNQRGSGEGRGSALEVSEQEVNESVLAIHGR